MEEFQRQVHAEFGFVFIPSDEARAVEAQTFAGSEASFQKRLKQLVCSAAQNPKFREEFMASLLAQVGERAELDAQKREHVQRLAEQQLGESSYETVPLVLPTAANGHACANLYIDALGRHKHLPLNARASRLCSEAVFGDAVLGTSFDDDAEFRRTTCTLAQFEQLMANPPPAKDRWSVEKSLGAQPAAAPALRCANCAAEQSAARPLKRCARCKRALYCSAECQQRDWAFHRNRCL